jgi:hypothetical protein
VVGVMQNSSLNDALRFLSLLLSCLSPALSFHLYL